PHLAAVEAAAEAADLPGEVRVAAAVGAGDEPGRLRDPVPGGGAGGPAGAGVLAVGGVGDADVFGAVLADRIAVSLACGRVHRLFLLPGAGVRPDARLPALREHQLLRQVHDVPAGNGTRGGVGQAGGVSFTDDGADRAGTHGGGAARVGDVVVLAQAVPRSRLTLLGVRRRR